jgi:uncharacterized membrane protein YuzA (DUF378 family)
MRDRILAAILISIMAFKVADYLFTLRAIYVLGAPEANPIIDAMLGTPWFFMSKIVFPAIGFAAIWMLRRRARPIFHYALLIPFAAYAWLTVFHAWWQWKL